MTTKSKDVVETTAGKKGGLSPWEEMDKRFDMLFNRGWMHPFRDLFPEWPTFGEQEMDMRMPKIDMVDEEEAIVVHAELPGVDKKDLEVNLSGQMLTIKGETRKEEKENKGEYYRSEISRGSYSRTLRLPEEVDEKAVKAEFKNGMLEVRLPKTHKVPRQRIAIE